jgi:hypothetical protein
MRKTPHVWGQAQVIPAKGGIRDFQILINTLDSGFLRSDDFSRDHQFSFPGKRNGPKNPYSFFILYGKTFSQIDRTLSKLCNHLKTCGKTISPQLAYTLP